jgi:hypothetical protein
MTNGRLRWAAVAGLLGAACLALPYHTPGFADEPSDTAQLRRIEGTWLALDAHVHGWRYVTRYDLSLTGNRVVAVGELIIVSPRGLSERYSPSVSEFSATIEGTTLRGEVSIYRRVPHQHGTEWTRPMRGTVDLDHKQIVISYHGPALDGTSAEEDENWQEADRTVTMRLLGKKERPLFE